MSDKCCPTRVRTFWADGTASDNQGSLSFHCCPRKDPQSVSGIAGTSPACREREAGKGLAHAPRTRAPSRPPAAAVQSPDVAKAGHVPSFPQRSWKLLGASPRLCNDVWSRWQGWVFLAGLTEPHLPGNSLQFQGIPSRCSHPQPC